MVTLFAVLLLAATSGVAALILAPLRRPESGEREVGPSADLLAMREAALQSIRDLDAEYQLGNLGETDYRAQRERYALEAIGILKEVQQAQAVAAATLAAATVAPGRKPVRARRGEAATAIPAIPATLAIPAAFDDRAAARRPVRRQVAWAAGITTAAVAVLGGAAWLYLSSRAAQQTQTPVGQLPAQVASAHGLAILPGNAGAATTLAGHDHGVLSSADGGRTWQSAGGTGDVRALAVHPARPQVAYAAGPDVFMKSEDGGRTWQPVASDLPGTDVRGLAVDPDDPDVLYAVVVGHGLYKGTSGGTRWTELGTFAPETADSLTVWSGGKRTFFLSTSDQGVFASADGRAWAGANGFANGLLPTRRVTALAYDPASGDRSSPPGNGPELSGALYAGTDQGLFKSTDAGGSWTRLSLRTDVAALAVDRKNPRALLVVDSRKQVFRSGDRGVTWRG